MGPAWLILPRCSWGRLSNPACLGVPSQVMKWGLLAELSFDDMAAASVMHVPLLKEEASCLTFLYFLPCWNPRGATIPQVSHTTRPLTFHEVTTFQGTRDIDHSQHSQHENGHEQPREHILPWSQCMQASTHAQMVPVISSQLPKCVHHSQSFHSCWAAQSWFPSVNGYLGKHWNANSPLDAEVEFFSSLFNVGHHSIESCLSLLRWMYTRHSFIRLVQNCHIGMSNVCHVCLPEGAPKSFLNRPTNSTRIMLWNLRQRMKMVSKVVLLVLQLICVADAVVIDARRCELAFGVCSGAVGVTKSPRLASMRCLAKW
ncbi:uncharacterized protein MYCFIDRAFT_179683 [Pseudocercospora fijiensis CIRAD86]|uniref:Uncharacterized protein n=1 Tax=Pseudocercospora fijiensis (strain CIRAD86) TaxID=383855 RepID=M3AJX7_PSEFD|nr:uncharacterized protein MYCFIDRAFT_179683 [Pseudocercospora fijiensis CIRAD86]EME77478.1 hypothetical protein MYCFIDRAFT_179683 [Pseudocercospora fijiensis CIRAD86]